VEKIEKISLGLMFMVNIMDAVALYKQAEQQLAESLRTTDSSGNFLN
jgi:hypothetical protein